MNYNFMHTYIHSYIHINILYTCKVLHNNVLYSVLEVGVTRTEITLSVRVLRINFNFLQV